MSDKIMVELTEAEICVALDALDEMTSANGDPAARIIAISDTRTKLKAALPVKWPNGTLAYVTLAGIRYGLLWKVTDGWSRDKGGVRFCSDSAVTKVEPVRIVPADHISIPRSVLGSYSSQDWRDNIPGNVTRGALLDAIADRLEAFENEATS